MRSRTIWGPALLTLILGTSLAAQAGRTPFRPRTNPWLHKADGLPTRVRARAVGIGEDGAPLWDYTVLGKARLAAGGGPSVGSRPGEPRLVNTFNNTITNGFFSVGTTGTEWVSWAARDRARTELIGAFAIGYATNARGKSEPGGTGATLGVSFFSGTTGFCNRGTRVDVPGDPDDVLDFTGLPGATGSQISPGFSVTVHLPQSSVFCYPDGKIGWSYVFREPLRGTTRNLTGPLLTELSANTCWSDAFDLWSSPTPVASCAVVFGFDCVTPTTFAVPPPCSSFWIQLFDATAHPGSLGFFDLGRANPLRYAEVRPARVGERWGGAITLDPANPAGPEVLGIVRFGLPGTISATGIGLPFLVNGSKLLLLGPAVNVVARGAGTVPIASIPVPKDVTLLGRTFNTQGFSLLLSPPRLQALNGISLTVGGR